MTYQYLGETIACDACGEQFTEEEWDARHTASNGNDIHADCCETDGPCYHDALADR